MNCQWNQEKVPSQLSNFINLVNDQCTIGLPTLLAGLVYQLHGCAYCTLASQRMRDSSFPLCAEDTSQVWVDVHA